VHDFEEIYIATMFHEMLSKPERLVTYQMVKLLWDQSDVTEVRNFRQYKSSDSSHPSKAKTVWCNSFQAYSTETINHYIL